MRRTVKRSKKVKIVEIKRLKEYMQMDLDSKVAMIQYLIPLVLMHTEEMLKEEESRLAGEKYKRSGQPEYKRWGSQMGIGAIAPNAVITKDTKPYSVYGGIPAKKING